MPNPNFKVTHSFHSVNPPPHKSKKTVIHHKPFTTNNTHLPNKILYKENSSREVPYGVSRTRRLLSPSLMLRRHNDICHCLGNTIGLTLAQREVVLRLLRYWAYYGSVYPKEAEVTKDPGCSKATFWRTIKLLEERGLVRRINRFIIRPHAQISNLYRLDKLVVLLARYLAEKGLKFGEEWFKPFLTMPGGVFWPMVLRPPPI